METDKSTIRNWAVEDRPREKFLYKGVDALTSAELIAILIGSGSANESAVELSRRILQSVNNKIDDLAKLDLYALCQFKGIGEAKAIAIIAALELGKRRKHERAVTEKITSSRSVVQVLQPILCDLPHEEFWVLYLNRANHIIHQQKVSQGGISGTVIDPRIIMREAIQFRASGIILSHNHPSGNTQPSEADKQVTKKLKAAGEFLDIHVLDHVIITNESHYSFADDGTL